MALMLGIRLVSWGLAGAVVGITHQYSKDTEEKLYKWVGNKFWRRSPDSAAPAPTPNSDDSVPIPSTADQLQPQVHNVVDGNLTAELSEERDLAHSVKPVSVDGARELQPTRPNAVNAVQGDLTAGPVSIDDVELTREAPDRTGAPPAVQGKSATEPSSSEVVNLRREAPDPAGAPPAVQGESGAVNFTCEAPDPAGAKDAPPNPDADPPFKGMPLDPPPDPGVWARIKARATDVWAVGLWARAMKDPHTDPPSTGMPPDPPPATGVWARIRARATDVWAVVKDRATVRWAWAMKDPGLRYMILHIPKTLLLVFVDYQFRRRLKAYNFWFEAYNKVFKVELCKLYAFF